MRPPIGVAFAALLCAPAFGEEVPFALAPQAGPLPSGAYEESLGEIMQLIQLKHVKLWQAGSASDWRLAAFETGEIRERFFKAAMAYSHIPVDDVLSVEKPLSGLDQAIKTRDGVGFNAAYRDLTKACNGCHQAAKVGFIVITNPNAKAPGDQKF